MTDQAVNVPRRSRHGQLRRAGGNGIDGEVRTSATACAASRVVGVLGDPVEIRVDGVAEHGERD
jgi:hypothetical protein